MYFMLLECFTSICPLCCVCMSNRSLKKQFTKCGTDRLVISSSFFHFRCLWVIVGTRLAWEWRWRYPMMTVICPTQSTGLLQWSKLLVGGFSIDKDLQCGDVHLHCSDVIFSWWNPGSLQQVCGMCTMIDLKKKKPTPIALGKWNGDVSRNFVIAKANRGEWVRNWILTSCQPHGISPGQTEESGVGNLYGLGQWTATRTFPKASFERQGGVK